MMTNTFYRHNLVDDSIACVRRQVVPGGRFESLSGHETLAQEGVHLVKVHTILPMLDEAWFLDEIAKVCRRAFAK
jgi:hypothetical protein